MRLGIIVRIIIVFRWWVRSLVCMIFTICGYHNYVNSNYVIGQEHAYSTTFYCFSRYRPTKIGCKHGAEAAMHNSGCASNAVTQVEFVEGRGRR